MRALHVSEGVGVGAVGGVRDDGPVFARAPDSGGPGAEAVLVAGAEAVRGEGARGDVEAAGEHFGCGGRSAGRSGRGERRSEMEVAEVWVDGVRWKW